MRISCLHGYFVFQERNVGDISDFISLFGLDLSLNGTYYTFTDLMDAPEYSIIGGDFLGATAIATFAGQPWQVMRQNGLIYDFTKGLVLPVQSVTRKIDVQSAGNYYLSNGMILPGSVTEGGLRVKDYAASFSFDLMQFKYSELSLE